MAGRENKLSRLFNASATRSAGDFFTAEGGKYSLGSGKSIILTRIFLLKFSGCLLLVKSGSAQLN